MAVPVSIGKGLDPGTPRPLFQVEAEPEADPGCGVTPDGQRFPVIEAMPRITAGPVVVDI